MKQKRQRKVLITGSEGFIGSLLCDKLRDEGYEVIPYDVKLGDDIFDFAKLNNALHGVDTVIHLAAYPHRHSVYLEWGLKDPAHVDKEKEFLEFCRLNVNGTKVVYDAAFNAGVRRFIYASSGAVYGIEDGISIPHTPIRICDVPSVYDGRLHAYARSKLLAEKYLIEKATGCLWKIAPQMVILRINWIQDETLGDGKSGPEWRGATCSMSRMLDGFRNAIEVDLLDQPAASNYKLKDAFIFDLIERNEEWDGSILGSCMLFNGM